APAVPRTRDFVPPRFSDACCWRVWMASSCRYPKTCTSPAAFKLWLELLKRNPNPGRKRAAAAMAAAAVSSLSAYQLLHRRGQLVAPARKELVGIIREADECAGKLAVIAGEFDRVRFHAPALLGLPQRPSTGSAAVDMAKGAAAGGHDQIRVAKILKEAWHPERIHAARYDRRRWVQAEPLLVVVGSIRAVPRDHMGDAAIFRLALHLAEAHGAGVDAGRSLQARHLAQHECGVSPFCLGRSDSTVARAVIVQVLLRKAAPRGGDRSGTSHIAVDEEGDVVGVLAKVLEDVLAARHHLVVIVRGDVE